MPGITSGSGVWVEPGRVEEWKQSVVADTLWAGGDDHPRSFRASVQERNNPLASHEGKRDVDRVGVRNDDVCVSRQGGGIGTPGEVDCFAVIRLVVAAHEANDPSILVHMNIDDGPESDQGV